MASNFNDFIRAIEFGKTFAKNEEKKTPRRKKQVDLEDVDPGEVVMKLLKRKNNIEEAIKQFEKLTKKEEKKDDKKGLNAAQIAMFMLVTSPITGPMMLVYWKWAFDAIRG